MRHIISILLQNEAGALARVAGLFAARGYNIDSLTVAATHDPLVSRLSLVLHGDNAVIDQIIKQSRKLIDVLDVADLTARAHFESELLIVKVRTLEGHDDALDACLYRHRAFPIDISPIDKSDAIEHGGIRTIQFAGPGSAIDDFLGELSAVTQLIELARSGTAALERGSPMLMNLA